MPRIAPAVVYLGPTLPRDVVAAWLPGADIRGPVRRGDLHRDRALHYSLFVIIDGVFFQDEALPPREVIDIIEDGAVVLGAASMGALRAAELWPVGMQGVGAVYRLFRRGVLDADDEVAVAFAGKHPHPPLSTALVDIRWALHRAIRAARLQRTLAEQLLARAQALFYAERCWPAIAVGRLAEAALVRLAGDSLKYQDGLRLLGHVQRLVARDPTVLRRGRRNRCAFRGMDATREAVHDPSATLDGAAAGAGVDPWLWRIARSATAADGRADGANAMQEMATVPVGVDPTGDGAAMMRYAAMRDAARAAAAMGLEPETRHWQAAATALARLGAPDLPDQQPTVRRTLALAKAWRERLFAGPSTGTRSGQP